MLGLLFATREEARPFLQRYARGRFDGLQEGELVHDNDLMVALTGVGKIKATLRTERLLLQLKPDRVLHVGTCTTLSDELEVSQLVCAAEVFEGDRIELAAPTYPRMPVGVLFEDLFQGILVTQDHTIRDQNEHGYWQRIADMTDMTGYAVAYVAATHGVPCHITKVVTGRFQEQDDDLRKTLSTAHQTLSDFLLGRLEVLLEA